MSIKVAITDDHPLAINGIKNMLQSSNHIDVTDTYSSGESLLAGLKDRQPDVLLLDVLLPDHKGQDLAKIITKQYPSVKILAITSLDAPIHVKAMISLGCKGYILKNADQQSLILAIETVYNGGEYIEPSLKEQLLQNALHFKRATAGKAVNLTRREKDVLKLIVLEYTNQQIADELCLSLRTVETHRFNLQKKLDVKGPMGLAKAAMQMGLIT